MSTFTPNKNIQEPAHGSFANDWDVPVNANWGIVDTALGGVTSISVTGVGAGTIALTITQYTPPNIEFTGTISGNLDYQLPTGVGGIWTLANATTGAFTLSFSIAGGSSLTLGSGRTLVVSDGTNVFVADSATAAAAEAAAVAAAAASAAALYVLLTTTVGLMTGVTIAANPGTTPSGSPGDLFLFY
jgi:hypothetical protein